MAATKNKVSKRALARLVAFIKKQHPYDGPWKDLWTTQAWDWADGNAAIVWEGGPYDWSHKAVNSDEFQALQADLGVWCEPYSGWALNVYNA